MNDETPPVFPKIDTDYDKSWKNSLWIKTIRRTVLLVVWLAVITMGYVYWQANQIVGEFQAGNKKQVVQKAAPELDKEPKRKAKGLSKTTTYLLIGSDIRAGESGQGRSDTILLVRIYPERKIASILSLPRDLYIPIPGYGEDRINAAYSYGGVSLLIKTIREWLGVPINHFFQVDFLGFAEVVDDLGGVYLPIDQRYYHYNDGSVENNWSSIDVKAGYQELSGEDALSWVRFRHLDSDFHRAARQQLFLREVGRELRDKSSDPLALQKIIKTIAKSTTSDIDDVSETVELANSLRKIPPQNIVRVTIEAESANINGADVLLTDRKDIDKALRRWGNPVKIISKQTKKPTAGNFEKNIKTIWSSINKFLMQSRSPLVKLFSAISIKTKRKTFQEFKKQRARKINPKPAKKVLISNEDPPKKLLSKRLIAHCVPKALPEGYYWPDEDAVHIYKLNGKPTMAAYATEASGVSVLWMWSRWDNPPILRAPSDAIEIKGKTYQLYWDSGDLRMVSWRIGDTQAWISNTLLNELSGKEMIALARSCQVV